MYEHQAGHGIVIRTSGLGILQRCVNPDVGFHCTCMMKESVQRPRGLIQLHCESPSHGQMAIFHVLDKRIVSASQYIPSSFQFQGHSHFLSISFCSGQHVKLG